MSYGATILEIMIASPSDVRDELDIVREVLEEWNVVHARHRGLLVLPASWDTHAWPQLGDRAQSIINRQVLDSCDLLIGIFWTKLGTPTGDSVSGTVEEIEEHVAAGKPAMLYFSSAPVRLESVDPVQYAALNEFKESLRNRGLLQFYDSVPEFRDKFRRHIGQTLNNDFRQVSSGPSALIQPEIYTAPVLLPEALKLLVEAAKDESGIIMVIGHMSGTTIQTEALVLFDAGNAREEARWRAAINQLVEHALIEDRNFHGEMFYLTDAGFRAADALGESRTV